MPRSRTRARLSRALAVTMGVSLAALPALPAGAATVSSRLDFDVANPTADPGGSGTVIQGEVSIVAPGVADFRGAGVVKTPDRANLDPGTSNFDLEVRLRLTRGAGEWNIAQKGYWGSASQYKLSLHTRSGGLAVSCRVKGSAGSVQVYSPAGSIKRDRWQTAGCGRIGDRVTVYVDGAAVARATGPIGSVASSEPYLIGGKELDVQSRDQYLGEIDWARVSVG